MNAQINRLPAATCSPYLATVNPLSKATRRFALSIVCDSVLSKRRAASRRRSPHIRGNAPFRAVALSVIPSVLFLFSGIMILSVPLILGALVFAPCHILISVKNVKK